MARTLSSGMNPALTRRVAQAVILAALGIALSPYTSIPLAGAKINPTQHVVNVVGAVLLGPWYNMLVAFVISLIRLGLGTGTPLAFPGSMIGAFIAGWVWRSTRHLWGTALGEIVGTGLLGSLASVYLMAPFVMGKSLVLTSILLAFSGSTILGSILGVLAVGVLRQAGYIDADRGSRIEDRGSL